MNYFKAARNGLLKVRFTHYRTGEEVTIIGTSHESRTPLKIKQSDTCDALLLWIPSENRWESVFTNTILDAEIVENLSP